MRLTIVVEDQAVGIDGVFKNIPITGIDPKIRAVQFDTNVGHIEYNDGTPNAKITDIAQFQAIIDAWEAIVPQPNLTQQEIDAHIAAIKQKEALYPAISKEVADTILSKTWKNLNVDYHYRKTDANIIGIYVSSAKGFEDGSGTAALLALRSLVELCQASGIPFFADLEPEAGVTLEQFTAYFETLGCSAIRASYTSFVYTDWNLTFAKASRISAIKAKRDALTKNGGHKIGTNWYHSNEISLIQQLALNGLANQMSAGGAPDSTLIIPTPWKTLSGAYVDLTVGIAKSFIQSALTQQSALFTAAQTKIGEVEALATLSAVNAYDINAGWPETYTV